MLWVMHMETNAIILGDCFDVLRELPDNSIDSVVTDPPYGLSKEPNIEEVLTKWLAGEDYEHRGGGFMGKTWDSFVPGPSVWREVYRVLKPGGHALVFAGTRTQDLMTISLRLAGFEVRDVIEWLYFSGFPKSLDISKQFDRRRNDIEAVYKVTAFVRKYRDKKGLSNADIDRYFGFNGMAGHWTSAKTQPAVPTVKQWHKLKEFLGMSDEIDELVYELNGYKLDGDVWAEREKIGERQTLDAFVWYRKGGYVAGEADASQYDKKVIDITAPATDLAKKWDGWGTALKPAHEPIIMARKPLVGTVAENVERFGTGALNIDGCRIPAGENELKPTVRGAGVHKIGNERLTGWNRDEYDGTYTPNEAGRFPANIVTTESDAFWSKYCDVTAKTGNVTPKHLSKKASKKDRNSDWRGEPIDLKPKNNMRVNAPRKSEAEKFATKHANNHPTVKPTDLMAWLVRLVTPPGGIVLDPFAGSGSTLVAAKREGFQYIGIEREAEYVEIAKARVG